MMDSIYSIVYYNLTLQKTKEVMCTRIFRYLYTGVI